jgi:hypothetical protein
VTDPRHIQLKDWSEFENDLRQRLKALKFTRIISFRSFDADRVTLALETGTDRNKKSLLWNADDFDYDHEASPSGKSPEEIIYVHRIRVCTIPLTVLNLGEARPD